MKFFAKKARFAMKTSFGLLVFLLQTVLLTAQTPKSAEVKPHLGRPTLFVNGAPQTPAFYALTHAYGGRWSWEEVPARNLNNFCQIGFRLYQVDLYFEDIWSKNRDTLDIAKAQRQVRGVLDQCPDAGVVIRIHVNAPFWWNEAHPDECTRFADGPVDTTLKAGPPFHNEQHDIHRALRASLASEKWRTDAGEKLTEFCRKLAQTPEGNAVIGMHVAGGIYGEWHYWGFIEHDPDTGPAMTRYFRTWLRTRYGTDAALRNAWKTAAFTLETATVPDTTERLRTHDGFFKDPTQDQRTIDYFTAQQQVVADVALHFCRLVKETWPRPLVTGIFYGYLHMTFNRQTVGGHLFVRQVMESPYVDYLAAPQTYWGPSRQAGGSGNSRGIVESALLHGKLWLDEIDNGYLHPKTDYDNIRYGERYDAEYASILRRCALLPLMRGIGFWFYDFGLQKGFGWWDNPKYLAAMRAEKAFFDARQTVPYRSEADVLYVWSQDVFYYLKSALLPISLNVLDHSAEQALRCGVVGDHVYDFDLDRVNLPQYKAVVFMNAYKLSDAQRKFVSEKVARGGRTLVFNYLTGFANGERLDLRFVQGLTGMKLERVSSPAAPKVRFLNPGYEYGFNGAITPLAVPTDPVAEPLARLADTDRPVIVRKKLKDFTSVYCALPLNGTEGFRAIFRAAGCHVYNEANDFTYAHSGLLLLHTKDGGSRTLRLRNGQAVTLNLTRGSTLLLDGQTGAVVLE